MRVQLVFGGSGLQEEVPATSLVALWSDLLGGAFTRWLLSPEPYIVLFEVAWSHAVQAGLELAILLPLPP